MSKNLDTICLHGGYEPKSGETNVFPICMSTTYSYDTPEEMAHLFDVPKDGHIYTRISNPTTNVMETKLAELDGGVAAMACSSGIAAVTLAVMTVAKAGDNILSFSTIYGGVYNLFKVTLPKYGIETKFVTPDMSDAAIEKLIDKNTKLFFAETVANPGMVAFDFDRYSAICKKHGLLLAIDNTLATPVLVRPLDFGANLVIYSSTKYLDGHAIAVGGIIVDGGNFPFRGNARYPDFNAPDESYHGVVYVDEGGPAAFILKARMQMMRDIGACISPFNAFLTNLGMETLHLRMKRHSENAQLVAEALQKNPAIEWVSYAGLPGDSNRAVASKYFKGGFSGMVVIGIKGGREKAGDFIRNLKMIRQLTHIADCRTCVLHPASTTHRQLGDKDLLDCGIAPNLVRLSIGLEAPEDIIADLEQALR
jgi:O-acetylhomoserine (thiol)-lyase